MIFEKDGSTPIFIQIKEKIKDDIMLGVYSPHELIISTTQIAKLFSVNPATAVKSVSLLQDEGIVYKKLGIGMCVSEYARDKIIMQRKQEFYDYAVNNLVEQAKKLNIDKKNLIKIIKEIKDYD